MARDDLDSAADPLYRWTLEVSERRLGAEDSHTLISNGNLAILLEDRGDLGGAEALYGGPGRQAGARSARSTRPS